MNHFAKAKRHAESCDQNRRPIEAVLREWLTAPGELLEIGSGTGQHAAYFAPVLPHVLWRPSDLEEHLPSIRAWCAEAGAANLLEPIQLDVRWPDWGVSDQDYVFSANTLHIMPWEAVEAALAGAGRVLRAGGLLVYYGPFNYGGKYTSESNARFDAWLKAQDPRRGVRDFEAVDALAREAGLRLEADRAMPANNRMLRWRKTGP